MAKWNRTEQVDDEVTEVLVKAGGEAEVTVGGTLLPTLKIGSALTAPERTTLRALLKKVVLVALTASGRVKQ